MKKIVLVFLVSVGLFSCTAYNTLYKVKAEQIIREVEYNESRETHTIKDDQGNVYMIFHVSRSKKDSVYELVKRMSYNRERSLQYYYRENAR